MESPIALPFEYVVKNAIEQISLGVQVNIAQDEEKRNREFNPVSYTHLSAELSLVDPDDLENTGVEVTAQPRGKRITKMMLMSGGEKSLRCV